MFPVRSRSEPRRADWLAASRVLAGLLLLYYLVPLASLAVAQPPSAVVARLSDADVLSAATTSVVAATVSTALAATGGLPLAYWLARADGRLRGAVTAVAVFPLVLPPIVSGMVLLTVVGPNAPAGRVAADLGLPLTRSLAGVVLAQTFVASPFVVLTATAAFEGVDRRLEDAARTLGRTRTETFRRVTLPLARPGVVAGLVLAFARSMGEFGATVMLAYYPRTMPVEIWVSFTTRGLDRAFPVAVILVAVSVGVLVVIRVVGAEPW